jgi:hypothetical protein
MGTHDVLAGELRSLSDKSLAIPIHRSHFAGDDQPEPPFRFSKDAMKPKGIAPVWNAASSRS